MAIIKPVKETTLRLQEETASKDARLMREMEKSPITGFYEPVYPVQVFADRITFELDEAGNRIDIYESKSSRAINLEPIEIMGIYNVRITLDDGTITSIGEYIAAKLDSIVDAKFEE